MNETGHIPQEFIDDLLTRIDIVEIINSYLPLKKKGLNYLAHCPFHQEKTPSFTVSQNKQFYHCFGCKASGNSINFLMQYEHLTFTDVIEKLAHIAGITIPRKSAQKDSPYLALLKTTELASKFYQQQLRKNKNAGIAIDYLKSRNISGQMAKTFNIGYASDNWDDLIQFMRQNKVSLEQLEKTGLAIIKSQNKFYDRFRNRILFPIKNHKGQVLGFGGRTLSNDSVKYLNSPETTIFRKNQILFGIYEALQANRTLDQLIVVEGYLDVIQLAENDITNAVATMGTALTDGHMNLLLRYAKKLVFCFDGDLAGFNAAKRALAIAMSVYQDEYDLSFLILTKGEDPDSYVIKNGKKGFEKATENALPLDQFFFSIVTKNLDPTANQGKVKLISTALPIIDNMPDSIMKHLLLKKLAKLVNLDMYDLKSYGKNQRTSRSVIEKHSMLKLSPTQLTLALLVQYPHLIEFVEQKIIDHITQTKNNSLLIDVIDLLRKKPQLTSGGLFEHWRDKNESSLLAELAAYELNIPEKGIKEEFIGLLQIIENHSKKTMISNLIIKAKTSGLNKEEGQQLADLIKNTKI